jgi:hypothetical protein
MSSAVTTTQIAYWMTSPTKSERTMGQQKSLNLMMPRLGVVLMFRNHSLMMNSAMWQVCDQHSPSVLSLVLHVALVLLPSFALQDCVGKLFLQSRPI